MTRFSGRIRTWRPTGGLAVVEVPPDVTTALGGLKQLRVRGTINGMEFASSTMPMGGGRLAVAVSKATMKAAAVEIGEEVEIELARDDRPRA